jgi:gliding motility-associated-like protein
MAIRNLLSCILLFCVSQYSLPGQSNYTLINNATQYTGCNCYQLTANVGNEGGGVYQNKTINLNNSFDYTFRVFLGCNGSSGADGMVFVLTNNITGIGASGGGLGYSGLPGNSVGIEFDTYQNGWDPPYNHIAIESGGSVNHPNGTLSGPVPALASQANIDDCTWHTVRIVWDVNTQTYSVYFDGSLRTSYTGNIVANFFGGNPIVNWGWSGSTGGSENQQIFCVSSTSNWVAGVNYQTCNPTVQFHDISTSNVSSIQSWAWTFGDPGSGVNNTSSLQNPTHIYPGDGSYLVTLIITDISGCADTFSRDITIDAPISLVPTLTNPLCNGGSNGDISLTPSGGFGTSAGYGGYTYSWSNAATTSSLVGVTAGTYNVTVTDGVCTTTATYNLSQPSPLSATTSHTDASCGLNNGSVTMTIHGGTTPYANASWDGIAGTTLSNIGPGTYVANFTDANGCSSLLTYRETVGSLPCGYTVSTSSTNVSCFGGSNGSVTLNVTGGVGPVSITWTNAGGTTVGTGATVINLPAGTYTYHYTDGVPTTFTGIVVVTQPGGPLTVSITTTDPTCSYLNNGTAVASVTANGMPNYSYAWSAPGQSSVPTATGLSPGTITVTVTDGSSCTATATGTVNAQPALNANVTVINDSCYHSHTGSATVTVSGGNPVYSYLWSNSAIGSTNYNIGAGTYVVTVTDHNSCTTTASGTVSEPPLLTATIADSNAACFGGATGSATVTPAGGNGGYTYIWSNATTNPTASGLTANTYYVTVTDSKRCKVIDSVNITQPAVALAVSSTHRNVACKGSATGSIALVITGGSSTYHTVTWSDGGTGTIRTNLVAGTYGYTVLDSHNCEVAGSVTITEPAQAFIITVAQVNISCFGGNNGSITLTPSGGTLPYATPLWLDGATGYSRTNLTAGTYYYADTDAHGCLDTGHVVITQPAQLMVDTISTRQVSCSGGSNGSIILSVSGGTYPYTYVWSPVSTSTDSLAINLGIGTYTAYVTDAHGCRDSITEIITQPSAILPSIVRTDSTSCFGGNNGTVTVTATGGISPYTYAIDGSGTFQSSGVFTGLAAGTHTVTVQDAHTCDSTISFIIYQPTVIVPSITYTRNVSCHGQCNGVISAAATGGTPPYTFSSDGINFSPVDSFTALCAGPYLITVKDFNGCTQTINSSISQPNVLSLSVTSTTSPSCFGGTNGQISVQASGGTTNYLYSIDFNTPQASGAFTGLSSGLHVLGVIDAHLCTDTIHVSLSQPAQLIADTISTQSISCFGGNNGAITIGVSGGSYPYTYVWPQSPGITDSLGVNLTAGQDTVFITDANGCRDTVTAVLSQPLRLAPFIVMQDSVACFGGNTGSVTVNANGGTSPYTYALDGSPTFITSGAFTGLAAGPHTVTVQDAHGCDSIFPVTIYQPAVLVPSIIYTRPASCSGTCDGAIAISATGGTLPYTYSKDGTNYSSVDSFTGLCAGHDTLYVQDDRGCIQQITDSITQPAPLTLVLADTLAPTCYSGTNGHIAVTAGGGTPVYSYTIDGGTAQAADSVTTEGAGSHTITVRDHNGCTQTLNITLGQPRKIVTDTISTLSDTCFGGTNGAITLATTGGYGPYSYSWTQIPGNTSNAASSLAAGTYTTIVTDTHGCRDTVSYTITEPAQPELTILPNDTTLSYGDTIMLSSVFGPASLGTPSAYLWSDTNATLSCTTCPNPHMTSSDSTNTYYLQVTYNNKLCTMTAKTTIIVSQLDTFAVADAFSPNGDGKNDTYYIMAKEVRSFHMDIYNRWGQTVFSTDDITQAWDGTFKGQPQPEGVYSLFFALEYGKNKVMKKTASLTLLR